MAKPQKPRNISYKNTTKAQGIGYFIPESMPNQKWVDLKQKWDHKLKQSGFDDIEMHSYALDGHFFPTFSQNSINLNHRTEAAAIGAGIEGYFNYCSTYYEHAEWRLTFNFKRFGKRWRLYQEIFRLHKDGVSFKDMREVLQGRSTRYTKRFDIAVTPARVRTKTKRSKYWLFMQTNLILEQMWLWHATDDKGSLTPYDLKHMQCSGITAAVILEAESVMKQKALALAIYVP